MKNLPLKPVLLALLLVLVIVIVLQNTESVETHVLVFTITMPRAVLLFVCAAIGFVLGLMTRRRILHEARPRPLE